MHMLVLVIKNVELVDELVRELVEAGLQGGTILDSTGMAGVIGGLDDAPVFGMLRHVLEEDDDEDSKTMFFVVDDEELQKTKTIIRKVAGDLNQPNTGIMFSLPVEFVEGLGE